MARTVDGYFLIADITGYTAYLSESELEHAHDILQSLLELLIAHTRPPLVISRLAGDAVISYALRENFLGGQSFIEMIEDTYVAFRRAIDLMVMNTTCTCNACANISTLDLKFFLHYGSFTRQRLGSHDELLGSDVIVIHRLLKNSVTETTGLRAYALYTEAAIRQLGIEDAGRTMVRHEEAYEHLGTIPVWIQDMHPVWESREAAKRIEIPPGQVIAQESRVFPVSVEYLWQMLTDPHYRALLLVAAHQNILNRQEGRIGPGSQYHCFHADGRETLQTVVEWRPFEQMTTEDTTPVPKVTCLVNLRLDPEVDGTRLTVTFSRGRGSLLLRKINDLIAPSILRKILAQGFAQLELAIRETLAAGRLDAPEQVPVTAEHIAEAAAESLHSH